MAAELRAENSLPSPMTAGLFVFLSRHSGMVRRTRPGISRFRVRCCASPRNDGLPDNPYRQRVDAADEIRIEPLWRPGDFKAKVAVQYFLPQNAYLLFGEAVADAAVDAGAEGEMLARLGAVDDELIRAIDLGFVAIA